MRYLYLTIVLLVALAGCGGGGGHDPLDMSGASELTLADSENVDDSLYESQSFKATRNGWIQVTMTSTDFDPYILVYRGTGEDSEVGHDDDSGTSQSAVFFFRATKDSTYTAKFTSYGSGPQTGDYTYTIKEVTGPTTNAATMQNPAKPVQDPAMKRAK